MELTFLEANVPLAKTFDKDLKVKPYPLVKQLTSHVAQVNDLDEFAQTLEERGAKGQSLLKGSLIRSINNESRAGLTSKDKLHDYIVIDVDHGQFDDAESVIRALPEEFHECSYVLTLSSSYKITKKHFAGHLFFLLDTARSADELKDYIKDVNLTHFRDDLKLNSVHTSILWPIDPSVNESSRLIYISPPHCSGFDDPVRSDERTSVVHKKHKKVKIEPKPLYRGRVQRVVNTLRAQMGLGKSKAQLQSFKGGQIQAGVERANTYELKVDRGFVYFNINGGDSWGYYHPVGSPDVIRNFKGEPNYLTKDLLPEYYQEYSEHTPDAARTYFVFREFTTDQYYNGYYDQKANRHTLVPVGSKTKLKDFLASHGQPKDDIIVDWDIEFDPQNDKVIDFEKRWINSYQPSDILREARMRSVAITTPPPLIERVLRHMCNGSEEFERYINWLAGIIQYRKLPKTAWIFSGIQGTGKGVMFSRVLSPILGREYCVAKRLTDFEDSFTGWMEGTLLLQLDEFRISDSTKAKIIDATLKNMITEDWVSVRHMRQIARMVRNFVALIICSNEFAPMYIATSDRRFNCGLFQAIKLILSDRELDAIDEECLDFATYLNQYKINNEWLSSPLINEARIRLQNLTQTTVDECIEEFKAGNFAFFLEFLPADETQHIEPACLAYKKVLTEIYQSWQHSSNVPVSRNQLRALFEYAIGNMPAAPSRFTKLIKHHGLDIYPIKVNERTQRGVHTNINVTDVEEAEHALELASPIRSVK